MATDFGDFELIPASVDVLSPDEELAEFVDPDELAEVETDVDPQKLPIGRNLSWDPISGQFGDWVSGVDSVVACAHIAFVVPLGQYEMFPPEIGREDPEEGIGQPDDAEIRALITQATRECLLSAHDRITDVRDHTFYRNADDEIAFEDVTVEVDGSSETRMENLAL